MATSVFFKNKKITLPGVYSDIISGISNAPITADYGKVLIIDTGLFAGYGGGPGVNGALKQGVDSLFEFKDITAARGIIRGGLGWKVIEPLYKPFKDEPGISSLFFIKANTTIQASASFVATGGGGKGGTFQFKTLDEGLAANGQLESDLDSSDYGAGAIGSGELNGNTLLTGYAWSIDTGINDTTKWIFKIWRGTFTGYHTDGISFDENSILNSAPVLVCQSPEFNNIQDLINWANTDFDFNQFFIKGTCSVAGDGSINQTDVTNVAGYNKTSGATETYNPADLTAALEAVQGLGYTHILCDKYGSANYNSATVGAIQAHIETQAKGDKYMLYGGGKDRTEFTSGSGSIAQAKFFDSNRVLVQHGDALKSSNLAPTGFRRWPTVYKAACVLGRCVGLPPQVPVTNKSIGIEGEAHKLSDKQREQALSAGVMTTFFDSDFNNFVVTQGINTLQDNTNVILANGKSFSWQAERIRAALNNNIVINAKLQLLGQPRGVNRNTLSAQFVKDWSDKFLGTQEATPGNDNLIISHENVNVQTIQDSYKVLYDFTMNGERTKLLFQGNVVGF